MSDSESQARAQVAHILGIMAALASDFDRLAELREERDDWEPTDENLASWEADNPRDAQDLADLEEAAGEYTSEDDAQRALDENALSVEVRSDWCTPGEPMTAGEYRILLCTGGPRVELVGDLGEDMQPTRVRVIHKDWGTHGEMFDFDHDVVLDYCSRHYFGE